MNSKEQEIINCALRLHGGRSRPDKSWPMIRPLLDRLRPGVLVDVGCGRGTFGALCHAAFNSGLRVIGIDVHAKYAKGTHDAFQAGQPATWPTVYHGMVHADFTKMEFSEADIFLFVDVLEHVEKADAVRVVTELRHAGKVVIASIPNESGGGKHWKQAPEFEAQNPHEAHRYDWTNAEVEKVLGLKLVGEQDGIGVFACNV